MCGSCAGVKLKLGMNLNLTTLQFTVYSYTVIQLYSCYSCTGIQCCTSQLISYFVTVDKHDLSRTMTYRMICMLGMLHAAMPQRCMMCITGCCPVVTGAFDRAVRPSQAARPRAVTWRRVSHLVKQQRSGAAQTALRRCTTTAM